jgi:hypothetical protein
MQITGGTAELESGSNVVTGTSVDWTQVQVGNYIIVSGLLFEISAIDLITDPTHPTLTLVDDWPNADLSTTNYIIQRDFSSQFRLPLLNAGDLEAAAIFTRAMLIIDGLLGVTGSVSNEITVTQSAHDFIIGNALRFNGTDWVKSTTASSVSSVVAGVVSAIIDVNTARIKTDGYITGIPSPTPLVPGTVYYLRAIVHASGHNITSVTPGETGSLQVPLLLATSTNSGYLLNLATAQSGLFAVGTPGLVPGPATDDGTLFLRDDGWHSVATSVDSIDLTHLAKVDPLESWPGVIDWENWFDATGSLSIWAHINDLHTRLGEVEVSAGNVPYTRLVYTRKNRFFGSGDDAELPLVIPDGVNEVIATLISGYVPYFIPTYTKGSSGYVLYGCLGIRLSLDTSVNKNLLINVGVTPPIGNSVLNGRATLKVTIGSENVIVGYTTKILTPPIESENYLYTVGQPIDGVTLAQIFVSGIDKLNGIYRSVVKDPAVSDGSWAYRYGSNDYATEGTGDLIRDNYLYPVFGHCGAVIIEYGAGAVFGVFT